MALLLYNLGISCYVFGIHIAQFFNTKARLWILGRRNWQQRYAADWQLKNPEQKPCVWMHCASLGEFEQGRSVIEALKKQHPSLKIVLSFFSPSGYEIRKNYAVADYVCYLPVDTRANALTFIELFQPVLSIFVKYEFWVHYLMVLHQKQIPILLISATFRANQVFFRWYGGLFRHLLSTFEHLFVQNQSAAILLQQLDLQNFTIVGDTRVDRVLQIAQEAPDFTTVAAFANGKKVLVIGSSWQPDEAILLPFLNDQLPLDWKAIIAPHDISPAHLRQIEQGLKVSFIRYANANVEDVLSAKVLLIDNVGMLAALYRYGRMAYIGGGFGAGIHNTLEPISFGLPVIFGPKFQKFEEAVQLMQSGGAFMVQNKDDFQQVFEQLQPAHDYQSASKMAKQYILNNQGATEKIVYFIEKKWHTKL